MFVELLLLETREKEGFVKRDEKLRLPGKRDCASQLSTVNVLCAVFFLLFLSGSSVTR